MKKINCIALFALLSFCLLSCTKETTSQNSSSLNAEDINDLSKKNNPAFIGRQSKIIVPTGDYTYPTSQALLWVPNQYGKTKSMDKKYPLIIALDGVGEQGTDINALLHTGTLAKQIADGWNATASINKKTYQFFVFTPQCPVIWGWSALHIKTMLSQLKKDYRIDTTRIYLTGYSAGGWGLWSCITDDESLCQQFAAISPVSTATADHPDKITNVAKYGIACWNICGTDDAFYVNAVNYTNIINNANPPIPAKLTGLTGVGHSAWYQAYDPKWQVDGKNLFQWMLQYNK